MTLNKITLLFGFNTIFFLYSAQQSCPNVNNLPPVEACAGRSSNCWSVGQADVDCPGNALCCFDGRANTCQGGGGSPRSNRRG